MEYILMVFIKTLSPFKVLFIIFNASVILGQSSPSLRQAEGDSS